LSSFFIVLVFAFYALSKPDGLISREGEADNKSSVNRAIQDRATPEKPGVGEKGVKQIVIPISLTTGKPNPLRKFEIVATSSFRREPAMIVLLIHDKRAAFHAAISRALKTPLSGFQVLLPSLTAHVRITPSIFCFVWKPGGFTILISSP